CRFMPPDLAPPRRRASASRDMPRPRARTRAIRPRLFFMVVVPLWRIRMTAQGNAPRGQEKEEDDCESIRKNGNVRGGWGHPRRRMDYDRAMDLSRFPRRRYTPFATPLEFLPNFSRALAAGCPGGKGPRIW